jgi:hypothetical protein
MRYDFKNEIEVQQGKEYVNWAIENKKRVEITIKRDKRTRPQNNYFHLLLGYFALHVGETLEYVKQKIFKEQINPDIFVYERINPVTGAKRKDLRSSKDLDTKELSTAIERFRNFSSKEVGYYLPNANEKGFLDHIENEIERHKNWL